MVTKWSIYWADLNPIKGSEQSGSRPVLVISNDIANKLLPVITILPLSSVKENARVYATEIFLAKEVTSLSKISVAMIHQIRTISKDRIDKPCGYINDQRIRQAINDTIKQYFELE